MVILLCVPLRDLFHPSVQRKPQSHPTAARCLDWVGDTGSGLQSPPCSPPRDRVAEGVL
jgi:hypothetical protein